MKNKNYILHSPYLRNKLAYDYDFGTLVETDDISRSFFFIFSKFWFFGLLDGKRAKNSPE